MVRKFSFRILVIAVPHPFSVIAANFISVFAVRRMLKRGGYGQKLAYRFKNWPRLAPKKTGNKRIWIQTVKR